ncbi:hypothetical protein [Mycoplasmopsis edwardii]|uniref:Uncharacterized protein n=1 Tax=Mycoplasmopsis edwardii TaxID=53558 RepID=A0ACD4PI65_9BACT|nr:hypothetical protein [Mycoplasmopsis edwardii]WBP84377.1 hypothetical protein Me_995_000360 [Mycoplasmopsis edwardii]
MKKNNKLSKLLFLLSGVSFISMSLSCSVNENNFFKVKDLDFKSTSDRSVLITIETDLKLNENIVSKLVYLVNGKKYEKTYSQVNLEQNQVLFEIENLPLNSKINVVSIFINNIENNFSNLKTEFVNSKKTDPSNDSINQVELENSKKEAFNEIIKIKNEAKKQELQDLLNNVKTKVDANEIRMQAIDYKNKELANNQKAHELRERINVIENETKKQELLNAFNLALNDDNGVPIVNTEIIKNNLQNLSNKIDQAFFDDQSALKNLEVKKQQLRDKIAQISDTAKKTEYERELERINSIADPSQATTEANKLDNKVTTQKAFEIKKAEAQAEINRLRIKDSAKKTELQSRLDSATTEAQAATILQEAQDEKTKEDKQIEAKRRAVNEALAKLQDGTDFKNSLVSRKDQAAPFDDASHRTVDLAELDNIVTAINNKIEELKNAAKAAITLTNGLKASGDNTTSYDSLNADVNNETNQTEEKLNELKQKAQAEVAKARNAAIDALGQSEGKELSNKKKALQKLINDPTKTIADLKDLLNKVNKETELETKAAELIAKINKIENPQQRQNFINRVNNLMNSNNDSERTTDKLQEIENEISSSIEGQEAGRTQAYTEAKAVIDSITDNTEKQRLLTQLKKADSDEPKDELTISDIQNIKNEAEEIKNNEESNKNKEDNFSISEITFSNITNDTANVRITFSNYELANPLYKRFVIEYNDGENKNILIDDYDQANNYLEFKLIDLNSNSNVSITRISLNGKNIDITNKNTSFNTLEHVKETKITNFDYKLIFEGDSKKASLSFDISNFEITTSTNAMLKVFNNTDNKDVYISFTLMPNMSPDFDNILFSILDEYEDESYGDSIDSFADGFLVDKSYELREILLVNNNNEVLKTITTSDGIETNINTTNNALTFNSLNIANSENNLNISLNLSETIETSKSVNARITGSNGWLSNIQLSFDNSDSKWKGHLNDVEYGATYTVSQVMVDNNRIFSYTNDNNLSVSLENNTNSNNDILIESVLISDTENKIGKKIIVNLNSNDYSKFLQQYQSPRLVIQKQDTTKIFIDLKQKNIENNSIEYIYYDLEENSTYTIKGISFLNKNVEYNQEFNTNLTQSKQTLSVENLNNILTNINAINLNKKWWASRIKHKITNLKTLLLESNLNISNYNLKDYDIELVIDESKWSNIDDLNGTLNLQLQLKSGSNYSNTKVISFNNLYSQSWIVSNKTNTKLFAELITISETGKAKSTKDFDDAFKNDESKINHGDLDTSLGGKPSIITEITDPTLAQFINIDESLMNAQNSNFKIFFVKYLDIENGFGIEQTTPYAMLGYIQYKILYWFNTSNFDAKYKNAVVPVWLGGYNNYTNKGSNDLFANIKNTLEIASNNNISAFNNNFGFKKDLNKNSDEILSEIKAQTNDEEKWKVLMSLTNLEKQINHIVSITQNNYDPIIKRSNVKYGIYKAEKVQLGENNFIKFKMYIKPAYTKDSEKQVSSVVNGNYIEFKLLVK